jgi:hypothetical protein
MLFGETVAVYCENHKEHTNTWCGQNAGFWCVKAVGTTLLYRINVYEIVFFLSSPKHCHVVCVTTDEVWIGE